MRAKQDEQEAADEAREEQRMAAVGGVRAASRPDHKHCGSLHAPDAEMAIKNARDVYTRRQEGTSVWVVRSDQIVASDPADKTMYFDPMEDKVYRHPTFYKLPTEVDHM
jgi:ring-1,2-phenylacetyl-CoA epoxidase subunit PaaB